MAPNGIAVIPIATLDICSAAPSSPIVCAVTEHPPACEAMAAMLGDMGWGFNKLARPWRRWRRTA
jgi:hypothetical protein